MSPMPRPQAFAILTASGQSYELEDVIVRGRRMRLFKHAPASPQTMYADAGERTPSYRL